MFDNTLSTLTALLAIMLFGTLVVMLPPLWNAQVHDRPARLKRLARRGWLGFLNDQVGGYVHDTGMSVLIPAALFHAVTGTWAEAAGQVSNTIVKRASLGNNTATVTIPICLPQNSAAQKGSYLAGIDVYWEVTGAALDALAATIYKATLPANGAAISAPSSQTFTYDTGHDSASERLTLDQHSMTLTLSTPFWVDNDDLVTVQLSVDGAASSVVDLIAARANFTLRI